MGLRPSSVPRVEVVVTLTGRLRVTTTEGVAAPGHHRRLAARLRLALSRHSSDNRSCPKSFSGPSFRMAQVRQLRSGSHASAARPGKIGFGAVENSPGKSSALKVTSIRSGLAVLSHSNAQL
jgi:hypothetical protein